MSRCSTAYSLVRGESMFMDEGLDVSYITLIELEAATNSFGKKIGKGILGLVYYGKMKDGKEAAMKIMVEASNLGTHQFVNEIWGCSFRANLWKEACLCRRLRYRLEHCSLAINSNDASIYGVVHFIGSDLTCTQGGSHAILDGSLRIEHHARDNGNTPMSKAHGKS